MKRVKAPDPLTYRSYLGLDGLLRLQRLQSKPPAHDELQFIIVHQVYELWFKLLIYEIEAAIDLLSRGELKETTWIFRRLIEIERVMIQQLQVIETMTPTSFLRFRNLLAPASGFQSPQFREVEFLSGAKDERFLKVHEGPFRKRLAERLNQTTLWDALLKTLKRRGFSTKTDADVLKALVEVYSDPSFYDLYRLCESMIEYDELFSAWRQRHALMAERMIGAKPGTGAGHVDPTLGTHGKFASAGVHYLKAVANKRFFPLLWDARTHLGGAY